MNDYRPSWMDENLDIYRNSVSRFVENEMQPHDERWREQGQKFGEKPVPRVFSVVIFPLNTVVAALIFAMKRFFLRSNGVAG